MVDQLVDSSFTVWFRSDYSVRGLGFVLTWECAGSSNTFDGEIKLAYDVDRPASTGGDILVRDGFFVHFISPESLPYLPKNIIFVIDKSGSMWSNNRMANTVDAFANMVGDLHPEDFFQEKWQIF